MEINKKPKAIRTCMNIIAFSALALFLLIRYCHTYYTPDEYVNALHRHDSIMIAKKSPLLAKNHVIKCIRSTKNIKGWVTDYSYDRNEEAYLVKYKYVENLGIDSDGYAYDSNIKKVNVWLRFIPETNNGDYKVKIKKVKSEKTVDKNSCSKTDIKYMSSETYKKDQ